MKTIGKIVKSIGLALVPALSLVMATLPAGAVKAAGNQPPTDIVLSNNSVLENQDGKTVVGVFSTTDSNAGDTFTYTLVSGTDHDNSFFYVDGNGYLRTVAPFDYETKTSYSILVRSTDQGGLWFQKVFIVTVTDVPEDAPPTSVIKKLITEVTAFQLPDLGITNSLVKKLESSISSFERGQIPAAVNHLGAFVNEVNAQEGKKLSTIQVSALGLSLYATAEATARSLKDSGSTASNVARVLRNTFHLNARRASQILQNVGYTPYDIAQALKVVFSATASEVAEILRDLYGFDCEQAFQLLKDLDYTPSAIWQALKDVFSVTASEVAEILKDLYGFDCEQVFQFLKDLDYAPSAIWQALKDVFSVTASGLAELMKKYYNIGYEGAAQWLKEAGYPADQTAEALKDVFNTIASGVARILKNLYGLGFEEVAQRLKDLDYTPSGIAQALKDVFQATANGVALWFEEAGYTAEETAGALKDVGFLFWDIAYALVNAFQIALDKAVEVVTAIFR